MAKNLFLLHFVRINQHVKNTIQQNQNVKCVSHHFLLMRSVAITNFVLFRVLRHIRTRIERIVLKERRSYLPVVIVVGCLRFSCVVKKFVVWSVNKDIWREYVSGVDVTLSPQNIIKLGTVLIHAVHSTAEISAAASQIIIQQRNRIYSFIVVSVSSILLYQIILLSLIFL